MALRSLAMFVVGLLLLQAAGCASASAPAARWAKAGATTESFAADHRACRAEAKNAEVRPAPFGTVTQANPLEGDRLYASCMTARGYRPDPQGFAPPEQSNILNR
jgi:hypothetical protein